MTLGDADVERILTAAETIEESLAVLADKQSLSRSEYRQDREVQDVVERRFVRHSAPRDSALGLVSIRRTLAVSARTL